MHPVFVPAATKRERCPGTTVFVVVESEVLTGELELEPDVSEPPLTVISGSSDSVFMAKVEISRAVAVIWTDFAVQRDIADIRHSSTL
jgi:hypothetical protein